MSKIHNPIRNFLTGIFALLLLSGIVSAQAITRSGAGADAAAIQPVIDQFRADLGGANNGAGGLFKTGRREVNWDGVPDQFAAPNNFPGNFFNVNSPRGSVFSSINSTQLRVSADNSNPTTTATLFADVDATYAAEFKVFSPQRLFAALHPNTNIVKQNIIEVNFFVPGTQIPATVKGFGSDFTDVDVQGNAIIECYGIDGAKLFSASAPPADKGLSFLGISFPGGERIAKVVIISGTNLTHGNTDGVDGRDAIAMDDFIYGEPRAAQFHSSDFDGDGVSDVTVFRPSEGTFFTLQSGSNTVNINQFGAPGDVPVNGDFDGDKLADTAIFRPSLGEWWIRKSSDGTTLALRFGQTGDKPVPGDYDKDGKSDIAVFRPSDGNWFFLRSSDNFTSFFGFPFGQQGDAPVGSAINP